MSTDTVEPARILIVDDDRALRHALASLLAAEGLEVLQAADGATALSLLRSERVSLMLLDVGLPGMSGLEVLSKAAELPARPLVVMMTADDTPETILNAVRGQAFRYVRKPVAPTDVVAVVKEALSAAPTAALPIEVVSAKPEWVEIVAPCSLEVADRLQDFVMQLQANLPEDVRESLGVAFREMLSNAVEWGGRLDRTRKVRIACLRTKRMLIYRIADPGHGFDIDGLRHAAISNPADDPLRHAVVREEQGLRPGGLGLAITRELVDELIYNEARNEVVFIKYLDTPPAS
jgi:CheY-like chemotaxis protein/anti-sigma regulatory factor (Ser/Thr protein kinase)